MVGHDHRVASNMDDAYLEGLKNLGRPPTRVSKKLGQIKDYAVYRSDLPQSGDFNLILVVEFANSIGPGAEQGPLRGVHEGLGKEQNDKNTEYLAENYPAMREITGEYNVRKITFKK